MTADMLARLATRGTRDARSIWESFAEVPAERFLPEGGDLPLRAPVAARSASPREGDEPFVEGGSGDDPFPGVDGQSHPRTSPSSIVAGKAARGASR